MQASDAIATMRYGRHRTPGGLGRQSCEVGAQVAFNFRICFVLALSEVLEATQEYEHLENELNSDHGANHSLREFEIVDVLSLVYSNLHVVVVGHFHSSGGFFVDISLSFG